MTPPRATRVCPASCPRRSAPRWGEWVSSSCTGDLIEPGIARPARRSYWPVVCARCARRWAGARISSTPVVRRRDGGSVAELVAPVEAATSGWGRRRAGCARARQSWRSSPTWWPGGIGSTLRTGSPAERPRRARAARLMFRAINPQTDLHHPEGPVVIVGYTRRAGRQKQQRERSSPTVGGNGGFDGGLASVAVGGALTGSGQRCGEPVPHTAKSANSPSFATSCRVPSTLDAPTRRPPAAARRKSA